LQGFDHSKERYRYWSETLWLSPMSSIKYVIANEIMKYRRKGRKDKIGSLKIHNSLHLTTIKRRQLLVMFAANGPDVIRILERLELTKWFEIEYPSMALRARLH
jgi:hypothetical protein